MQSILDAINEWIKEILIGAINGNLSTMFGDVNEKVGTIAAEVGQTPQGWNANIFSMIQTLSENVIVPIAGLVITYVLCYELISMVTEKNNMHDVDTSMFFKWVFKAFVAVYLVTHTFDITMAVFDMAQHVVSGAAGVIGGSTEIDVAAALASMQSGLDAMEIPELLLLVMETSLVSLCIFFNEFNRYKKKSESGQVFTPDHITSFMYRLIEVNQNDKVLDAACGSGAFLVKAMCNMMKEAGGINTKKASKIKDSQLFGIEFDREIFALACANMLIHKDGKTNLEHLDSRTQEACDWIKSKNITKVLMNPPFESKYGCLTIVENVLKNVPRNTKCAFILPDKKLEKDKKGRKLLKHSTLEKIIKLPEKVFSEGVTTSIFIFTAGIPQNDKEIFACYIEDDGLETVKNQGRQDIKDRWQSIEDKWVDIIRKQSGDDTVQWIKPSEHLSYQMPEKPFEIFEEDFTKTMMDYLMFKQGIDVKEFSDSLVKKVMYDSKISSKESDITIVLKGKEVHNETN